MWLSCLLLLAAASPWQLRGDAVAKQEQAFFAELERDRAALHALLEARAPELLPRLEPAQVSGKETPYGYQLLPKVVPSPPPSEQPDRAVSTSFSWPKTSAWIEEHEQRRRKLRERLEQAAKLPAAASSAQAGKAELAALVDSFLSIQRNQAVIDQQVKYNRFWQQDIEAHRGWYDGRTALHDQVLARQALLDALAKQEDPKLRAQEQALAETLHRAAYGELDVPRYATVSSPKPGLTVLHLAVATDIADAAFLKQVKQAVESRWRARSGSGADAHDYRLELTFQSVLLSPAPARGAHIDIAEHLKKFPEGLAVLTTGAMFTHAATCCSVVLGPGEVAESTLAHEFGHLLEFRDAYIRGYRDLGADGFEVLEIFPDPGDIMCSPGNGRVMASHFEAVMRGIERRGR